MLCALQQHLPFTVLKPTVAYIKLYIKISCNSTYRLRYWNNDIANIYSEYSRVATAPTVYGIETTFSYANFFLQINTVATAPTVYGIETFVEFN